LVRDDAASDLRDAAKERAMTANHAQMHLGRRDMARELAQKLTGQQEQAEAELRRCEGAMGALSQMQEAICKQRAAFETSEHQVYPPAIAAADEIMSEVEGGYRNLKTAAELNMVALRGRVAMLETALDLCEAAFDQESEALKAVLEAVANPSEAKDAPAQKRPRPPGEKPPPPIARTRKAGGVKK
jgi:hypothetical protein